MVFLWLGGHLGGRLGGRLGGQNQLLPYGF